MPCDLYHVARQMRQRVIMQMREALPLVTRSILLMLFAGVAAYGCTADQQGDADQSRLTPAEIHQAQLAGAQRINVGDHDHWEQLRDSDIEIDYVRLFSSEPGAAEDIIVRARGRVGEVGRVNSDTICWVASRPGDSPVYEDIAVVREDHFAFAAEESTVMLRSYWPIDANRDGIDDLLILGWQQGDQVVNKTDEQGIWQTRRVAVDRPIELRLVQRGPTSTAWRGVVQDRTWQWDELQNSSERFVKMLDQAIEANTDQQWHDRLTRSRDALESSAQASSAPARPGQSSN